MAAAREYFIRPEKKAVGNCFKRTSHDTDQKKSPTRSTCAGKERKKNLGEEEGEQFCMGRREEEQAGRTEGEETFLD